MTLKLLIFILMLPSLLLSGNGNNFIRALQSEKMPLENRVWYTYPNEQGGNVLGPTATDNPSVVARVLNDGHTQANKFTYNSVGNVTLSTGQSITQNSVATTRITTYNFDSTGIDLQSVTQTVGAAQQTLSTDTFVYPPTSA